MSQKRNTFAYFLGLTFILIGCVAIALYTWITNVRDSRSIVDLVTTVGGEYCYAYQLDSDTGALTPTAKPRFGMLSKWIGKEYFNSICEVNLSGFDAISDADVALLSRCTSIQRLLLGFTSVTDNCLPYLSRLTHLRFLALSGARVSMRGLEQLLDRGTFSLNELALDDFSIDDSIIDKLVRERKLKSLSIDGTNVSVVGAEKLRASNCEILDITWK